MKSLKQFCGILISVFCFMPAHGADRILERAGGELAANVEQLRLASPIVVEGADLRRSRQVLDPVLAGASGRQKVIVRLLTASPARIAESALPGEMLGQRLLIESEQSDFGARCHSLAPSARVLGSTQLVLNAVFLEVDASELKALASDPSVSRIAPIGDYELFLGDTVPYIGAAALQGAGVDGSGVRVAVLDSGIDYNHANLGGSGVPADFASNDPTTIEPGSFPTAKVVDGFDFVGSSWPGGPETFDPDPLDDGFAGGHGTHVADIIAGSGGVAPGADLLAVKVCSSISSSCSGLSLILGMEFAVDPNGDGDPSDAVDVINMSLGSNYGQPFDDDLSQAVNNATALGVLTVASAGNAGDKPYVSGTPAAAATALSVAQTQVPSAALQLIDVAGVGLPAVFQPWSTPLSGVITGPVQYGDGAGGNLNGCGPFAAGSLAGLIVLVDRGACNFTLKIKNVGDAGGLVGIIGLVAPGAPFAGGNGGDSPITVPGFMISQADANFVKAFLGSPVTLDPSNQLPLVMQMVGSSSRGPRNSDNRIKPEIGAPGASVSAVAGSGVGVSPFGGTSGAAPMVSGSAALILDLYGNMKPKLTKALLMNTGETNIDTDPFSGPAPITRIGGGEVRPVNAALARAVAWDRRTGQGALSFGFRDVAKDVVTLKRKLRVKNLTNEKVKYNISTVFRFPGDEATGAVEISAPSKLKLNPGQKKTVKVELTIHGGLLPGNSMNSGSMGADPSGLTLNEYDGYLLFEDTGGGAPLSVPWHVLPRQAAKVKAKADDFAPGSFPATVKLKNKGVGIAQVDAYSLLAVSPDLPRGGAGEQSPTPDIRALGVNTFLSASCSSQFVWAFAFNTWERQTHLLPVIHEVALDIDQDGTFDFAVFNLDLSGGISDGRQATWAQNLTTGAASVFFFAEHATNTGNTSLYICGEQVGLTSADIGTKNVDIVATTYDFYFGGPGDSVGPLTVTPLGEQYFAVPAGDIPANSLGTVDIFDYGMLPGNTPELGVMLFTNGDRGVGARGGATRKTEATIIGVAGADLSALDDDDDDDDCDDPEHDHGILTNAH